MKKTNVIIVHGAYGHPEENWFGWLKRELNKMDVECLVPQLPTPHGQTMNAWMEVFFQSVGQKINQQTILIGHSLGAVFILRWLEQCRCHVAKTILVGAFLGKVNQPKFDFINESFFQTSFNWENIKAKCKEFICYHGMNDVYVSRQQFDFIANNLRAKKIIVAGAGHFNAASGYVTFPHIFELLACTASRSEG